MTRTHYWNVKIGFYKSYIRERDTYCESSAHIGYEDAKTPLEAIRLCAEWRNCPDPATWTSVDVTLYSYEDEPRYVSKAQHP